MYRLKGIRDEQALETLRRMIDGSVFRSIVPEPQRRARDNAIFYLLEHPQFDQPIYVNSGVAHRLRKGDEVTFRVRLKWKTFQHGDRAEAQAEIIWPDATAETEFAQICSRVTEGGLDRAQAENLLTQPRYAGLGQGKVRAGLDKAESTHKARAALQAMALAGGPLSQVTCNPNGLRPLWDLTAPSPRWTVLIDESGEAFDVEDTGHPGRFVVLCIPDGITWPDRIGFHASECAPAEVDKVLQDALDRPVGALGLALEDMRAKGHESDVWIQGVVELLNWALRLLPFRRGQRAQVEVLIEQKAAPYLRGEDLRVSRAIVARQLAESDLERARAFKLERLRFVDKTEPLLPFVDALAHTFAARRDDAKERLALSGLEKCLLGPSRLRPIDHDALVLGDSPDPDTWQRVIRSRDTLGALGQQVLERTGHSCRTNPQRWRALLLATVSHLESKARSLDALGHEVAWLAKHKPENEVLSPALELAWATARLGEANHRGETGEGILAAIERLSKELLLDDARLVAHADLHLAVASTNRFDFARAGSFLQRWDASHRLALGRKLWGRVLSSRAQHAAFVGDFDRARALFDEALAEFGALTDPRERADEARQTRCYRAIVLMDMTTLDTASHATMLEDIAANWAVPTAYSVAQLARDTQGKWVYGHHLILRYLVRHPDQELIASYLAALGSAPPTPSWAWPWPMIEAYRALLLWRNGTQAQAQSRLRNAIALSRVPQQGPTVRAIGLALEFSAGAWGISPDATEIADLESKIPLASERFSRVDTSLDFLAKLRHLLPFNFC